MTASSGAGVDPRLAGVLCYSAWWVTGLVFLAVERRDRTIRLHAAQSVVLFGAVTLILLALAALSVLALVVSPASYPLVQLLSTLVFFGASVLWLMLMLRSWRGEVWRVPMVARIAERLV